MTRINYRTRVFGSVKPRRFTPVISYNIPSENNTNNIENVSNSHRFLVTRYIDHSVNYRYTECFTNIINLIVHDSGGREICRYTS